MSATRNISDIIESINKSSKPNVMSARRGLLGKIRGISTRMARRRVKIQHAPSQGTTDESNIFNRPVKIPSRPGTPYNQDFDWNTPTTLQQETTRDPEVEVSPKELADGKSTYRERTPQPSAQNIAEDQRSRTSSEQQRRRSSLCTHLSELREQARRQEAQVRALLPKEEHDTGWTEFAKAISKLVNALGRIVSEVETLQEALSTSGPPGTNGEDGIWTEAWMSFYRIKAANKSLESLIILLEASEARFAGRQACRVGAPMPGLLAQRLSVSQQQCVGNVEELRRLISKARTRQNSDSGRGSM